MAKYMIILMLCLTTYAQAQPQEGDCGREKTRITYSHPTDYKLACEGISEAEEFYLSLGLDVDAEINIEFKDVVYYEMPDAVTGEARKYRVYGLYMREGELVQLSSITSDIVNERDREHFSMKVHEIPEQDREAFIYEMHRSTVIHEMSHLYIQHNFMLNGVKNPGHGVHEFLAYLAQISTLKPELRQMILDKNPSIRFHSPLNINGMIHASAPHMFGVKSYRYYHSEEGGASLISEIISGRLNPDAFFNVP